VVGIVGEAALDEYDAADSSAEGNEGVQNLEAALTIGSTASEEDSRSLFRSFRLRQAECGHLLAAQDF
jgi:hypothetical protein